MTFGEGLWDSEPIEEFKRFSHSKKFKSPLKIFST